MERYKVLLYEDMHEEGKVILREKAEIIKAPHMAAHTEEALKRMSRVAVDIIRVLEGKEPVYPVNRPQRVIG
jgi:lactate dehydrogenase-like 2-hydroxyacid dehydrogenase